MARQPLAGCHPRRQGTYVVEKITPFVSTLTGDPDSGQTDVYLAAVTAEGREPVYSSPTVEIQQATDVVADALRVDEGSLVVSRYQKYYIDGTPWSLQTSFYPMRLVEAGAVRLSVPIDIEEGAVKYIADECGIKQAGYRDSIAVRAPDDNEAAFFSFPDDGRIGVRNIPRGLRRERRAVPPHHHGVSRGTGTGSWSTWATCRPPATANDDKG